MRLKTLEISDWICLRLLACIFRYISCDRIVLTRNALFARHDNNVSRGSTAYYLPPCALLSYHGKSMLVTRGTEYGLADEFKSKSLASSCCAIAML